MSDLDLKRIAARCISDPEGVSFSEQTSLWSALWLITERTDVYGMTLPELGKLHQELGSPSLPDGVAAQQIRNRTSGAARRGETPNNDSNTPKVKP